VSASRARVLQTLTPVVEATGHDLEDVTVSPAGKRRVVRVLVDKDGGVTLDDVTEVSRAVSDALDALDAEDASVLGGAYVLEVSSPGVDRPLTAPRHWRRNQGRLVKATLADGPVVGRVLGSDDLEVVLDVDGTERTLLLAEISRAVVEVEFSRGKDNLEDAQEDDQEDEA
jgi:ribosome maturation factor RimP